MSYQKSDIHDSNRRISYRSNVDLVSEELQKRRPCHSGYYPQNDIFDSRVVMLQLSFFPFDHNTHSKYHIFADPRSHELVRVNSLLEVNQNSSTLHLQQKTRSFHSLIFQSPSRLHSLPKLSHERHCKEYSERILVDKQVCLPRSLFQTHNLMKTHSHL